MAADSTMNRVLMPRGIPVSGKLDEPNRTYVKQANGSFQVQEVAAWPTGQSKLSRASDAQSLTLGWRGSRLFGANHL